MRKSLLTLFLIPFVAFSQGLSDPGYVAGLKVVAAGGGGCTTPKDTQDSPDSFEQTFLRYIATKFRAGSTYNLCQVDLSLARNLSEDADFLVTIRADSSGSPAAGVLATSATVPNASLDDNFAFISFTFASPASLTSGSDYWIVITRADNDDGLQLYWEEDNDGGAVEGVKNAAAATPTTWVEVTAVAVGIYRTFSQ